MFCPNCHRQIDSESVFCLVCGKREVKSAGLTN